MHKLSQHASLKLPCLVPTRLWCVIGQKLGDVIKNVHNDTTMVCSCWGAVRVTTLLSEERRTKGGGKERRGGEG